MAGARRLLLRPWRGIARRALLALCLWPMLLAASATLAQEITAAKYIDPTDAYPHGVLGDDIEWGTIQITVRREKGEEGGLFHGFLKVSYNIAAPPDMVFEDTAPRLWDIDGDSKPEVVIVLSHQDFGAQLGVIGYRDGAFSYIATTPTIGTRFRWLAPVGAADLDGDGHIELAFVHTPHLSKTLHVWRYANGRFDAVTRKTGLTNHQIGWDHIPGGIRICNSQAEIITANADWSRIMASRFNGNAITSRDIAAYKGPDSLNKALTCP